MARRPQWIAALLLALGIAAGFAVLGQWQVSRSVENAAVVGTDTEDPIALPDLTEPRRSVSPDEAGRLVTVEGDLVAGDFVVLTGRDQRGVAGAWLVGHLVTSDGVSLAVALGWAADAPAAEGAETAALDLGRDWSGRYLPTESPQQADFEAGERNVLAVAELVNVWTGFDGEVYGGYLVVADAPEGLEPVVALPPEREVVLNWLNVFYAIEWAVFAGFALYLWYRLVRDAVEKRAEPHA